MSLLHSQLFDFTPSSAVQGDREWGYTQFVTAPLCCSFFLTLSPWSCVSSSPRAVAPVRSLLQCRLSTGCSFFQAISICCSLESSMGCSVDICFTMVLHGLQGDSLLHFDFSMGCKKMSSLASGARPPLPPLTWVSAGLFPHNFFPSILSLTHCHSVFCPFLNMFSQGHH